MHSRPCSNAQKPELLQSPRHECPPTAARAAVQINPTPLIARTSKANCSLAPSAAKTKSSPLPLCAPARIVPSLSAKDAKDTTTKCANQTQEKSPTKKTAAKCTKTKPKQKRNNLIPTAVPSSANFQRNCCREGDNCRFTHLMLNDTAFCGEHGKSRALKYMEYDRCSNAYYCGGESQCRMYPSDREGADRKKTKAEIDPPKSDLPPAPAIIPAPQRRGNNPHRKGLSPQAEAPESKATVGSHSKSAPNQRSPRQSHRSSRSPSPQAPASSRSAAVNSQSRSLSPDPPPPRKRKSRRKIISSRKNRAPALPNPATAAHAQGAPPSNKNHTNRS